MRTWSGALLAAGTAAALIIGVQPAIGGTTGMVRGTVYDCGPPFPCATPMPTVPFASVELRSLSGWPSAMTATTDKNGFFSFVSVEPGRYFVYPRRQGYAPGCTAFAVVWADQTTDIFVSVSSKRWFDHCYTYRCPQAMESSWVIDTTGEVARCRDHSVGFWLFRS